MPVVPHHLAMTYTWSVGWYHHEPLNDGAAFRVLSVFIMLTQAFFMGAFFLIAAYLTPGSFERWGALSFIDERILRLVIPLLAYRFGIAPAISLSVGWFAYDRRPAVVASWDSEHSRPLWFLELLLVLNAGWLIWQRVQPNSILAIPSSSSPPTWPGVVTVALSLGLATWLFRIWLPVSSDIEWVGEPAAGVPAAVGRPVRRRARRLASELVLDDPLMNGEGRSDCARHRLPHAAAAEHGQAGDGLDRQRDAAIARILALGSDLLSRHLPGGADALPEPVRRAGAAAAVAVTGERRGLRHSRPGHRLHRPRPDAPRPPNAEEVRAFDRGGHPALQRRRPVIAADPDRRPGAVALRRPVVRRDLA